MIDTMAERYHLLPSEVLRRANTLDLSIMDISLSYRDYLYRKSQGGGPQLETSEMESILERARQQHG